MAWVFDETLRIALNICVDIATTSRVREICRLEIDEMLDDEQQKHYLEPCHAEGCDCPF